MTATVPSPRFLTVFTALLIGSVLLAGCGSTPHETRTTTSEKTTSTTQPAPVTSSTTTTTIQRSGPAQ